MMKRLIYTSILLLSVAFAQAQKPNIIFILADDMGIGDVACYGGKVVPTPYLDRMANEGRRFTQYYSASPICSPSRAGILTGSHPATWNITSYLQTRKGNAECAQVDFLTPKAPSVARELKKAGYHTAHFGKWHMGGGRDVKNAPPISAYGFDEFSSTWESPNPDPLLTSSNWIWAKTDSVKRWNRTGYWVDRTLSFLEKNKGQACFVNLWPDDVHTPWIADEDDQERNPKGAESRPQYEAVLKEYDKQIGRLLEGLKQLGLDQNTLVIFTSDNGALPTFGFRSGNFRGSKLSLYEGGIRMPFIVRYPKQVKPGTVDSVSVLTATDLLQSFCKLAGVTGKTPSTDGVDRSAVLLGTPSAQERTIYWEYGRNQTSFRYPEGRNRSPNLAVREGTWKLLVNSDGTGEELYHLGNDPYETTNRAAQHVQVVSALKEKVLNWFKRMPSGPDRMVDVSF